MSHGARALETLLGRQRMMDGWMPLYSRRELDASRELERAGVVERRRNIGKLGGTWARLVDPRRRASRLQLCSAPQEAHG